ncbi:hypothetical protein GGR57DRAFT_310550 [Xylariaceae sp. FL1272]|nr:hypothetical protein GGR57DRAFT_310550 [Xylariaceae sp. FL1272]
MMYKMMYTLRLALKFSLTTILLLFSECQAVCKFGFLDTWSSWGILYGTAARNKQYKKFCSATPTERPQVTRPRGSASTRHELRLKTISLQSLNVASTVSRQEISSLPLRGTNAS